MCFSLAVRMYGDGRELIHVTDDFTVLAEEGKKVVGGDIHIACLEPISISLFVQKRCLSSTLFDAKTTELKYLQKKTNVALHF